MEDVLLNIISEPDFLDVDEKSHFTRLSPEQKQQLLQVSFMSGALSSFMGPSGGFISGALGGGLHEWSPRGFLGC